MLGFDANRYRQYGLWERYAALYPENDLVFTVGKSDESKDWFFAQVTRCVTLIALLYSFCLTSWMLNYNLHGYKYNI